MKKKVVFVGLSGGVDSAVSAALLKKEGYEVVGVFIKTWHPDFIECNEEEERRDAMRVAAHLGIPFLTFDLEVVYKKEVADYMIREYKAGRTPNPDVMCNKEVKFGAFLRKALAMGADYVATGHYAQNKNFSLVKGVDSSKDQSYFLWTLKREQISKILFPIGRLEKSEVRKLAKKWKLPVAAKKDSQGICFLGPVDLKEFLKHYIKEKKGKVVNTEGNKDIKKNILVVSQKSLEISHKSDMWEPTCLTCGKINWISEIPKPDKKYTAQIRYHGELLLCKVVCATSDVAQVTFEKPIMVAPGQSIVVYDGDICLGGGVVE
ncbi:MAG: tRNA-specific 2-thiouridylase MnmA [Candidatus Nomurabacteria bacterium GW2011_GWB1_47_6]|uniref:tRNA-uridine 2-sulfurtransferase n=1 Tax=Candidatus Nomurabacteria bacterium GW2011_GWB1_47_6 TaxID=1618749 RepID=A0A0G1W007_9BACT|nr:MAG: tRNA-specific 2-thiouridylase MnmA [Candidatus Nomurabacteria bacterium GW2011_GWB1_47_6]